MIACGQSETIARNLTYEAIRNDGKEAIAMARRFRLRELEQKYGDLHELIPPLVNATNQYEAARQLTTSQATISTWLKKNGYTARLVYERTIREQQTA